MNKRNTIQIRQGDVFLESVATNPNLTAAQEIPPTARGVVLQEGEVTGHAHRIGLRGPSARHATLYRTETDARYLRVTAPVELTHEEHKTTCAICRAEWSAIVAELGGDPPEALGTGAEPSLGVAIAVARIVDRVDNGAYRCASHAASEAAPTVKLDDPGATVIPPGDYAISIHAEYVPGALPRQVED
jgi:hypothetical protein